MLAPNVHDLLNSKMPDVIHLECGPLRARTTVSTADIRKAQSFRARFFALNKSADADAFDASSIHLLVEDHAQGILVACCRLKVFEPEELTSSYSGQFYDLSRLQHFPGRMIEIGRFCVDPVQRSPDILRLAWALIAKIVDTCDVELMFGCSSFPGTGAEPHRASFDMLFAHYRAPDVWRPCEKSKDIVRFHKTGDISSCNFEKGWAGTPSLLRTYLAMCAWVSDHAVVDYNLNTLHVFTGVEIAKIPPMRKKQLRQLSRDQAAQLLSHEPGLKAVDAKRTSA